MALTPEDVVNKRFQPTKFREGYDQDEVDDFLDEVVVELRRLNQENEELRQRLIAGESRISELQRSGAAQAQAPAPAFVEQPQFGAAPIVAAAAVPVPVAYPAPADPNSVDPSNTNNLLQLARKLHEEHVREGIEKRDALIAEGHAAAARVVSEAEKAQRDQVSTLEQERQSIEGRIEDLRTFEREYRLKLRSYIESQLHELESPNPMTNASQAAQGPAGQGRAEQGQAEQGRAEQGRAEQGQAEQPVSAQTSPIQPQSMQAQPVQSQPIPVQAAPVQSVPVQSVPVQPAQQPQFGEQPAQQAPPAFNPIQSAPQPSGYQGFGGN